MQAGEQERQPPWGGRTDLNQIPAGQPLHGTPRNQIALAVTVEETGEAPKQGHQGEVRLIIITWGLQHLDPSGCPVSAHSSTRPVWWSGCDVPTCALHTGAGGEEPGVWTGPPTHGPTFNPHPSIRWPAPGKGGPLSCWINMQLLCLHSAPCLPRARGLRQGGGRVGKESGSYGRDPGAEAVSY